MIKFTMTKRFKDGTVIEMEISGLYLTEELKKDILQIKKLIQEQEENQEKS